MLVCVCGWPGSAFLSASIKFLTIQHHRTSLPVIPPPTPCIRGMNTNQTYMVSMLSNMAMGSWLYICARVKS